MRYLPWIGALLLALTGCDGSGSRAPAPAASAAPAATAAPTPIGSASPSLHGKVVREGRPLAQAVVVPIDASTGKVPADLDPAQLFTAADGSFELDLPPGTYDLRVAGEGGSCQITVDLTQGAQDLGELEAAPDQEAVLDLVDTGRAQ